MKDYIDAAQVFNTYLTMRPGVIHSYVQELRQYACSFRATSIPMRSLPMKLVQSALHLDDAFALQIKIAQTDAQIGDYATAISMYSSIMSNTNNDYTKSQMDYRLGEANHLE